MTSCKIHHFHYKTPRFEYKKSSFSLTCASSSLTLRAFKNCSTPFLISFASLLSSPSSSLMVLICVSSTAKNAKPKTSANSAYLQSSFEIYQSPACIYKADNRARSINRRHVYTKTASQAHARDLTLGLWPSVAVSDGCHCSQRPIPAGNMLRYQANHHSFGSIL